MSLGMAIHRKVHCEYVVDVEVYNLMLALSAARQRAAGASISDTDQVKTSILGFCVLNMRWWVKDLDIIRKTAVTPGPWTAAFRDYAGLLRKLDKLWEEVRKDMNHDPSLIGEPVCIYPSSIKKAPPLARARLKAHERFHAAVHQQGWGYEICPTIPESAHFDPDQIRQQLAMNNVLGVRQRTWGRADMLSLLSRGLLPVRNTPNLVWLAERGWRLYDSVERAAGAGTAQALMYITSVNMWTGGDARMTPSYLWIEEAVARVAEVDAAYKMKDAKLIDETLEDLERSAKLTAEVMTTFREHRDWGVFFPEPGPQMDISPTIFKMIYHRIIKRHGSMRKFISDANNV